MLGTIFLLVLAIPFTYLIAFVIRGYQFANKLMKEKSILQYYEELRNSPNYSPIDEVSTNIKFVIICLEDACFFKHHGYNLKRILYAFWRNLKHTDRIGGSTITQQLAKNMYFSFKKTYRRKVAELFVARKLEKTLTKEQILDIYLNIIYYGMEQYSIKEACEFYFEKKPLEVSLNEAITLGCLLPAPTRYNPLSEYNLFGQAKRIALRRLVYLNVMDEEDVELYQSVGYNEKLETPVNTNYEETYKNLYEKYRNHKRRIGNGL